MKKLTVLLAILFLFVASSAIARPAWDFKQPPIKVTDCSGFTVEGILCWDTDDDILYVGTGSGVDAIGGSGVGAATIDGSISDHAVPRGTAVGTELQDSNITIDDSDNIDQPKTARYKQGGKTLGKIYYSTSFPTADNDGVDTAALGIQFDIGDVWVVDTAGAGVDLFIVCWDNSTGAAVWTALTKGTASAGDNTVPTFQGSGGTLGETDVTIDGSNNITGVTSIRSTTYNIDDGNDIEATITAADGGKVIIAGIGNTNNEALQFDMETTANAVGVSSSTGVDTIDYGSIGDKTTGARALGIQTASKSTTYTIGTDDMRECYGGVIYVTSAATITACDALDAQMNFTVITIGAIAVSLDTQTDDLMNLDGTPLDDGDKKYSRG
jgi:hypothetical protein